jgi:pimeloyl-ACP methyl ester carboxylesterase
MKSPILELDEAIGLEVDGVEQRLRLCAARRGLPPVLIIQGGPGLPLLNEAPKFRSRLSLEDDFTVAYWDQRGCGPAAREAADTVGLGRLLDDLRCVLRHLHARTGTKVALLGISIGGTLAIQAAARERELVSKVVAVSPDLDAAASDDYAYEILNDRSIKRRDKRMAGILRRLGPPPYTSPSRFQQRLRLLANEGSIERDIKFGRMAATHVRSLVGCYGLAGAASTLRNTATIQARLLPALAELRLFDSWPETTVPLHLVFGADDILMPPSVVETATRLLKPDDSLVVLPRAGHMVHFDRPEAVKGIVSL